MSKALIAGLFVVAVVLGSIILVTHVTILPNTANATTTPSQSTPTGCAVLPIFNQAVYVDRQNGGTTWIDFRNYTEFEKAYLRSTSRSVLFFDPNGNVLFFMDNGAMIEYSC